MAQFFFRAKGVRGSVISGPYQDMEAALIAVHGAGLKARDVGFLRKDGPNLVKIDTSSDYGALRNTG